MYPSAQPANSRLGGCLARVSPRGMARAIWSGNISFGLVNAPVRMYAAVDEHDLELHLVHVSDGSPIGYRKYCKKEDKAVPEDEIAKAFDTGRKLVLLDDDDFAAAQGELYKAIEILDFVPYEQIDPIYFERSYYLGPQDGGEKVYELLVEAMEQAELAALARYVFHDRERLGCLRVRDRVLVLERMYFADEIRPHGDVRPRKRKVDREELELALALIERITSDFDPTRYEDRYRERLLKVIRAKQKGREVVAPAADEAEKAPDLLTALRESVSRAQGGGNGSGRRNGGGDELGDLTAKQLADRAKKLDIEGRSKMTKRQLVSAIEKAEG